MEKRYLITTKETNLLELLELFPSCKILKIFPDGSVLGQMDLETKDLLSTYKIEIEEDIKHYPTD